MLDWAINTLYFPNEELAKQAYEETCIDDKFTFEAIIPYPTTPDVLDHKYIISKESVCKPNNRHPLLDWYHWCCDQCGFKLDCSDAILYRNTITFKTPQIAPYPILHSSAINITHPSYVYGGLIASINHSSLNLNLIRSK